MYVVATAGHVDHGKSTLLRALTGMEPDRLAEERRRGLTIDLGYAWLRLPSGDELAFVDVPGHRRFIGNMLAGLGPAPVVLFVVAADAGWQAQSEEHLRAIEALDIETGVVAVTRRDLADPAATIDYCRKRFGEGGRHTWPIIAVSGTTGAGQDELIDALAAACATLPAPDPAARARMWVDRAFSRTGHGTIVTGTLGSGEIRVGDRVAIGARTYAVRGLHALGSAREAASAPARVALDLRGLALTDVARGDAVVAPQSWPEVTTADVLLDIDSDRLPEEVTLHAGTVALPARVRPLAGRAVRLRWERPLPLAPGDRLLVRAPGEAGAISGALTLDVAPPPLRRRGAAAELGERLLARGRVPTLTEYVADRGHLARAEARLFGYADDPDRLPGTHRFLGTPARGDDDAVSTTGEPWGGEPSTAPDVGGDPDAPLAIGAWWVSPARHTQWRRELTAAVRAAAANRLDPTLSLAAARRAAGIPDTEVLEQVAHSAGLTIRDGRIAAPDAAPELGAAETGLQAILARLAADPCAAPEQEDLAAAGLGPRQLAAAVRLGRILRLPGEIVLAPDSPARAMRVLAALPQPFTTSAARAALGTTRRVAIPLLEHLDERGWTRRVDGTNREVVRRR